MNTHRTPNRTGRFTTGPAPTPYAAIEIAFPLPPGEQEAFFEAFQRDIAEPLGLVGYSGQWWCAYKVAQRSWLGCLEHGWKIGRREAEQEMKG